MKKVSNPEELREGYAEVPGIRVESCEWFLGDLWPFLDTFWNDPEIECWIGFNSPQKMGWVQSWYCQPMSTCCHFVPTSLRMEWFRLFLRGEIYSLAEKWSCLFLVKVGWSWLAKDFGELRNWSCQLCLGFRHMVFDFQWAYNACKATEGQRYHSFVQHWCLGCW